MKIDICRLVDMQNANIVSTLLVDQIPEDIEELVDNVGADFYSIGAADGIER